MRIRSFQDEDLEALCEIDRICFPEDTAFTRAEFAWHVAHPQSITRVGEGLCKILGFVIARMEMPSFAHIITLDVIPEARNHNIGTSLMKRLHRELKNKGIEMAILEVSTGNSPAQRLYEKLHYRYFETLAGYYGGREDAYRMACLLD